MKTSSLRRIALLLPVLLAISSCGGGTGGSGMFAGGGTGGTGVSHGSVTAKGSIFVNGVEFSTDGATILRDDVPISEDDLRVGMIVEVLGSFVSDTTGVANKVMVEEAVRGPVEALPTGTPATGAILFVLGQIVHVDDATIIDTSVCDPVEPCATLAQRFAAIDIGDLLEVHGLRTFDGSIAATFIEKAAPIAFVVRGTAASHNAAAQTFTIVAPIGVPLIVNYGSAVISDMPVPSGSNWDGLFVEVTGTCAILPVCGTLTATKVEPEGLAVADAAVAEIEGFVTAFVSILDFTVNSQRVVTTPSTVFLPPSGIVDRNVKLEVEGVLADGVLTATKVIFK